MAKEYSKCSLEIACLGQRLHFVVGIEFFVNVPEVLFHCLRTECKLHSDLLLLQTLGPEVQDISFSCG